MSRSTRREFIATGAICAAGLLIPAASASGATRYKYQRGGSGTPSSKLYALIQSAAANRSYTPTQVTKALPQGSQVVGPNAAQGVVWIPFDPASGVKTGTNRIFLNVSVRLLSNVRLEVDSGVELVDATNSAIGMLDTNGAHNWSMTVADTSRNAGYWSVDTSYQPSNQKSRLTHLQNSSNWAVQWLESKQYPQASDSATCVIPMHSSGTPGLATSPRNGLYQHHKNTGSGPGWGPNQITSLYHSWVEDLRSVGGVACRLETDGNAAGVHNVAVRTVHGENGDKVINLSPWAASSDHVSITGVTGVSCHYGLRISGTDSNGGEFTNTSVTGGCIWGGNTAQDLAHPTAAQYQSINAVDDSRSAPARWTNLVVSGIGRSGTFSSSSPGGDPAVTCDKTIATG